MAGEGPLDFEEDPAEAERRARLRRRQDPDLVAGGRPATGEPQAQPPARLARGASRYGWFIGVVGVLLIALVPLSNLQSEGPGSRGLTTGGAAPPFAAPLALAGLEGDVNVAVRADSGEAGAVPACSVRRPDVLNLCTLYERGPVVLAFFATRGEDCVTQLDLLDQVAARHPDVAFAAISIRGDRDDLRRTIRDRRWRFPVGYDADGILANAYGVAVCPQITFIRKGGAVQDTSLGTIDGRDLEARVRRLER
jgi:hypothetical protein